jgi:hypothetical protein
MNKSEQINELAKALAVAQGEMHNPAFDAKNPHFRSAYASLASVRNTVLPVLSKHGLSIIQMPVNVEGNPAVSTMLLHASGQFVEDTFTLPADKQNAHGYGSALTYLRRYSLMAVAGVVGDDDDDGNAAVESVGLDEAKIAAYVFRIAEAVNESVLKKVYAEAYGYAKSDQAASKAIIAAKDKRKSELQIEIQGQA